MNQLVTIPSLIACAAISTLGYMLMSSTEENDINNDTKYENNDTLFNPNTELTDETFKKVLSDARKNKEVLFIDIYAPWCGWCRKMADEWNDLIEEYEDEDRIHILTLDGSANENAKKHFGVKTFPTLILYNGKTNKSYKHRGDRTLENFKLFIEKRGN